MKLPKAGGGACAKVLGLDKAWLLEEQPVWQVREGCGGVEGRESLGRAGHIGPCGLHGGLLPQRGR